MSRPRFLGSQASTVLLIAAAIVVALWLCGVAWMLLDVSRLIIGGKRACS